MNFGPNLALLWSRYNFQWLQTVQPVKELYQCVQGSPLVGLHRFAQAKPSCLPVWLALELAVLPLGRDGVAEEELRSSLEFDRD